jgi:hypothetical protein
VGDPPTEPVTRRRVERPQPMAADRGWNALPTQLRLGRGCPHPAKSTASKAPTVPSSHHANPSASPSATGLSESRRVLPPNSATSSLSGLELKPRVLHHGRSATCREAAGEAAQPHCARDAPGARPRRHEAVRYSPGRTESRWPGLLLAAPPDWRPAVRQIRTYPDDTVVGSLAIACAQPGCRETPRRPWVGDIGCHRLVLAASVLGVFRQR